MAKFNVGDRVVYWPQDGSVSGLKPEWAQIIEVFPESKTFRGPCYLLAPKKENESWEDFDTTERWETLAVGENEISKDMDNPPWM